MSEFSLLFFFPSTSRLQLWEAVGFLFSHFPPETPRTDLAIVNFLLLPLPGTVTPAHVWAAEEPEPLIPSTSTPHPPPPHAFPASISCHSPCPGLGFIEAKNILSLCLWSEWCVCAFMVGCGGRCQFWGAGERRKCAEPAGSPPTVFTATSSRLWC